MKSRKNEDVHCGDYDCIAAWHLLCHILHSFDLDILQLAKVCHSHSNTCEVPKTQNKATQTEAKKKKSPTQGIEPWSPA